VKVFANFDDNPSFLLQLKSPRRLVPAHMIQLAAQGEHVVRQLRGFTTQLQRGFQRLRLCVNVVLGACHAKVAVDVLVRKRDVDGVAGALKFWSPTLKLKPTAEAPVR